MWVRLFKMASFQMKIFEMTFQFYHNLLNLLYDPRYSYHKRIHSLLVDLYINDIHSSIQVRHLEDALRSAKMSKIFNNNNLPPSPEDHQKIINPLYSHPLAVSINPRAHTFESLLTKLTVWKHLLYPYQKYLNSFKP